MHKLAVLALLLAACSAPPSEVVSGGPLGKADGPVPEFGDGAPTIETLATSDHGLATPRDLQFRNDNLSELFIVNQATNSVSVIFDFGSPGATIDTFSGPGSEHFCAKPSALAFGNPGVFATAHEEDDITQPSTPWNFMGPTLWTAEHPLFDAGHQSHIDMLHNSPNAVGIAHFSDNKYFVFDGEHESITYYDFRYDHGPGGADHTDGVVYRFVEGQVSYVPGTPSHLEVAGGLVYVADTGNNRVAVLDPEVGYFGDPIQPNYDGTVQQEVLGGSLTTLVDGDEAGLLAPSGIAIAGGRIFVSDAASGEIVAFDMAGEEVGRIDTGAPGINGITVGPDGDLYFVNADEETLGHVAR